MDSENKCWREGEGLTYSRFINGLAKVKYQIRQESISRISL